MLNAGPPNPTPTPATILWAGTVRKLALREQLQVARSLGCAELSISPYHYTKWLGEGIATKDMLAMASDAGVRLSHLDPLARWFPAWTPSAVDAARSPIGFRSFAVDDFIRIAEALGVTSFSAIVCAPIGAASHAQLVDSFGHLCSVAASRGMHCDLEFIPFWGLPSLSSAWSVVDAVDQPNCGIVLDFWHYCRGERDDELLAAIPAHRIGSVQICDAPANPTGALIDDCLNHRRLPGDGSLPVDRLVNLLHQRHALNRVGPEIFSATFDQLSPDEIIRLCREALAGVFTRTGIQNPFGLKNLPDAGPGPQ